MKVNNFIKSLKYHSSLGFVLALIAHKVYVLFKYRLREDRYYIAKNYKNVFKKELNLEAPKTINEKIQWYKLNFKHPLIVQCSDKYAVRDYVSKTIGAEYLVPLCFHTKDYKQITPENMPDFPFIIKANHTAGTNHIVKNKSKVNWKTIQTDCRWWLHLNYSYMEKEWQYGEIEPRIVVEKLLMNEKGQVPSDYKLHCVNGKFEFLQVDLDRFSNHKRNMYDKDWNLLPFTWSILDSNKNPIWDNGGAVKRPENLELLIELGEKLAKPFPYVRVDFYNLNNKIYFGELTFHHGGGYEHFTPNKWDEYYGEKIPLKDY